MSRIVSIGMMTLVAGILGWPLYWSLGTCRPLDRWLGFSGCKGSVEIAGLSTLSGQSLSVPDENGMSSIFGWVQTADGFRAGMIRLNPATGEESRRYPLRMQNGFSNAHFAADGKRAILGCSVEAFCTENGANASIIALADGTELEAIDSATPGVWHFPSDKTAGANFPVGAIPADQGRTVVIPEAGGTLRLSHGDGREIGTLLEASEPGYDRENRFSVSPSGRFVALAQRSNSAAHGDRILIWDGRSGARLTAIETRPDYRIRSLLTWAREETDVFAVRQSNETAIVDRFGIDTGMD